MGASAFPSRGRWFRGNLHTHSDRSDGVAPPERVIAEYRAAGYDFLVLSDHFEARWRWAVTDTAFARDDGFTTLLGAELSSTDWDDEDVFWVDRLPVDDLHAVETFNVNAAHSWPDQAEGRYAVDALLARRHRLHVAVGDDAHWLHRWDRFGAWVQVRAERLEPRALLKALHAGAYYSTQGPRIDDVRVDGDRVHVVCTAARAIALTGIHGWRSDVAEGDPTLEEAVLDLGKLQSPYWRLTVAAQDGRRAWTNPVWS
jgi:hypothetical protein